MNRGRGHSKEGSFLRSLLLSHYIINKHEYRIRLISFLLNTHSFSSLLKTTGSANEIINILLEQWIMFGNDIALIIE